MWKKLVKHNISWKSPQGWESSFATCFHLSNCCIMSIWTFRGDFGVVLCMDRVLNPCQCLFTNNMLGLPALKSTEVSKRLQGQSKDVLNCKSRIEKRTRGEQMETRELIFWQCWRAVGGEQLGFGRRMNKWWDVLESKCPNKTSKKDVWSHGAAL